MIEKDVFTKCLKDSVFCTFLKEKVSVFMYSVCMLDILRQLPYFTPLSMVHLELLSPLCQVVKKQRDERLFYEGDDADSFYAVISGQVKILKISPDGREVVLHLFGKGEIFAEVPIFNDFPYYPANAMVTEETTLLRVEGAGFRDLVTLHPQILLSMMSVFAARLHQFSRTIEDLSLRNVDSRLAKYLLTMSEASHTLELTVNKKTLAAILATVPETLSRSVGKLQQKGLITMAKNHVVIHDREALMDVAMINEEELAETLG